MPEFVDGTTFFEVFDTPQGRVLVLGEVVVRGQIVTLENVLIEPMDTVRLDVGPAEIFHIRRNLLQRARSEGYTYLEIAGMRMSGANPHRPLRIGSRT